MGAMAKLILVLMDACRFDAITQTAGYLEHMIDYGKGAKYRIRGELPSMSRPMYETLMTGLPVWRHGIVNNDVRRLSRYPNLFSLCREHGLVTAAAAYVWYSELYNNPVFNPLTDRYQLERDEGIQHGIFYFEDQYPDSHLFLDGEFLRQRYNPDFLLMHSMNIDYWGHLEGSDHKRYTCAVQQAAEFLSRLLPVWLEEGYQVAITADHGMNSLGLHGGPTEDQRTVPLYLFSDKVEAGRFTDTEVTQLNVAPLLCWLLEIPPAAEMKQQLEVRLKGNI